MRTSHSLVCALALCAALSVSAQSTAASGQQKSTKTQRPTAGEIDPLSFTLFSYLGNSLLWAAGNVAKVTV
jgi:hypothetical protein